MATPKATRGRIICGLSSIFERFFLRDGIGRPIAPFSANMGLGPRTLTNSRAEPGKGDPVQGSAHKRRRKPLKPLGPISHGRIISVAVTFSVLALAGPAAAGNLTITPSLELREIFSDNIDLAPDGLDESALTTEVVPGFTLRSESARWRRSRTCSSSMPKLR